MKRPHLPVVDLEDLTARLLELYPGPAVRNVLALDVPRLAAPLLALVDHGLTPEQPAIDRLIERLLNCTIPHAALDPRQLGTDVVWARLIARVLDLDPALAREAGVRWWQRADRLGLDAGHLAHPVVASMSCYTVAVAEEALSHPARARRWMKEADAHVEAEEPGVSMAAWVRACVLLNRVDKPRRRSRWLSFWGPAAVRKSPVSMRTDSFHVPCPISA